MAVKAMKQETRRTGIEFRVKDGGNKAWNVDRRDVSAKLYQVACLFRSLDGKPVVAWRAIGIATLRLVLEPNMKSKLRHENNKIENRRKEKQ